MKEISIRDVRTALTQLKELLAREGELVITRHGKPIARPLPAGPSREMPSHAHFRTTMPRCEAGSEA